MSTASRPRKVWDIALSIVLLVLSYGAFLIGAVFALISVAFIDYCPEQCNAADAASSQIVTGIVLAIVALIATAVTVLLLVMRRRGWWVACASLVVMIVGWIVGFVFYELAVGGLA